MTSEPSEPSVASAPTTGNLEFLHQCRALLGTANVIDGPAAMAAWLTDWRQRFTGSALAVLRPVDTAQVAAVVSLCQQFKVPMVPQGGNTGLVLGGVPDASGTAVVLSLSRLNRIRALDTANNTVTAEAGCVLAAVQGAAAGAGRLFPLSLASEGSCTIGGNLSTNAGGTAVLRHGNMRELCLGLEVVTAQGQIWDGLSGLRKDNTGYQLRDLFIGSEGTLGVITAAVLKLVPAPKLQLTALAGLSSIEDALRLLALAQARCGAGLTGFELISLHCMKLVGKHFPKLRQPLPDHAQYVLLELSDHESEAHARSMLEGLFGDALSEGVVGDAAVAESIAQSLALWQLREHIPLAQAAEGKNVKHDISVPISRIAEFVHLCDGLLSRAFPGCQLVTFGHLGDGNLHYNVAAPAGVPDQDFLARQSDINRVVHDTVREFGGSISAEHGIGALKRDELRLHKSGVELDMMRAIKRALDPMNLMNPGKVL